MILSLKGKSKNSITYTPDWIRVYFIEPDGDRRFVTFDIQGDTDYNEGGLDCCTKGDLNIWEIDGNPTDIYDDDEAAEYFNSDTVKDDLYSLFNIADEIEIGLYPTNDQDDNAMDDEVTDCNGGLSITYDDCEKYFNFTFTPYYVIQDQ